MAESTSELHRLKSNMQAVINAYCEATGTREKSALVKVVGSLTPRNILLDPEADIKAGKYDEWVGKFAAAWPEGHPWPAGVPRPQVSAA